LGKIDDAVKSALAIIFLIGVVFPWNAKFGIASNVNPKFLHVVPEVLMLILSVAGLLAL
jgi:cytochrome bd-type quinol oxidase subunit 1